ncbi:unnamed protein product [Mytilus edulis]|uniref:Endonuclease n=1 Tax=Mytilus edulis TaxID=6550 RepID=A0A8S3UYS3_MYTED|nr:unnamed protein product [Mytilus edulis]
MGHVDLPITIGNYTIIQKFTVAEIDVPAVIGYDFLHKNNCTIDMGKGVLLLKDSKIDCIKESQMSSTFKIKLSDKLTIPPNTEVIISGIVEGDSSSIMNAIVEPLPSKHTETLLVAKALVDPSCGQVPIRMVNLSKYEQIMQPFTHVATCELIDTGSVSNEPRSEKLRRLSSSSCDEVNELPSLLQDLKLRSSELLSEGQIDQLESLLKRHNQTFSKNKDDLGRATAIKHKIDTGNAKPVKQPPRRLPLTKRDEVDKEIQRLLDGKIIEPSKSPWASCIVPVTKKDGSTRICIDFRPINSLTIKDSYPLCRIDDSLDALRGSKWLSVLDLSSGYWQVEMDENDKEKTAFTSTKGLFHFNVMPMGLCNGVATFQRLMEYTLAGLNWQTCLIYIDDIIVFSDSFESHLSRLSDVLDRIALQGLKVSPKKCSLFQKQVSFLGHIVSSEGIATDPDKIASVKTWPLPKSMTDVRSFLGTCSYYRKFIKSFAEIARPLHKLTEKNCTFDWTNECNEAFEKLQMTLMSAPILGYPDMTKQFILDTDASGFGIGAVLSQIHEGKEVVVAYYSKSLSKAQRQYCVTRRELLADQKEIDNSDETFETVDFLRMAKVQDSQEASCSNKTDSAMWYEHKTNEEMFEAQKSDNVLFNLFRLKSDYNNRPEWADVALHDVKLKKYWSQWDRIVLINNVLYRKWINTTTEESNLQFIVPEIWKENIMKMLHDDIQVGHFGIHKTVARAQNRFYWVNHKDEITKWVQNCIVCNSRKQPPRKAKSKMKQYNVGAPMERVALDIIGPLPISYKNNKYALIVTDYFTKWVEGFPMPDMETTTIVDNLVNHFFCRFGIPCQMHSDQGRQFESGLFKELCAKLKIDKTRTTSFRPQSNGLVERYNRTLENTISKYISKNQRDWDEQLPWALMAYNSSEHETTKFSPSMLMLGRELQLPVDLIYGPHPQEIEYPDETVSHNDYVKSMQESIWKVSAKARQNISKNSDKQKRQYDVKAHENTYKTGDVVWLYTFNRKPKLSPKLQRNWDGPYFVIEVISDLIYKIKKTATSKMQIVHHDRLKPFFGDVQNWVNEQENQRTDNTVNTVVASGI